MATYWERIAKVFTILRKGKKHCKYCCERMTIIHNRYGTKVWDYEIKFCFHCGRRFK